MKKYLRNNTNLFDKVEWVKQMCSEAIGVSDEVIIRKMLSKLRTKGTAKFSRYGVLRLSQRELVLDQLLKSNEISPRTAYSWFILIRAPKDVCELGRNDKISQNEMKRRMKGFLQKRHPEQEKLRKEIMKDILKVVEAM
ncbi:hypothetical protein KY346_00210 [Candidatus Woesearchaeota archaeon]|nr:hypothetical protein [Candidatus Woesearchaeota archaeon]